MLRQIIENVRSRFKSFFSRSIDLRGRHRYLIPLCLVALYSASTLAKEVPVKSETLRQGGALFSIERDGHTVYLFGTIHVGRADFFPLAPQVMTALNQSSRIAIEIDASDTQAVNQLIQRYALYPDDSAAAQDRQEMPAALKQALGSLLKKYRIAPTSTARMKPWLLATVLMTEEYARHGYPKEQGVDNYLSDYAQTQNKPLIGLESVEYQLSLLGNLSIADQTRFLQDSVNDLRDPVRARKALQLVALWRSGDLVGLNTLLKEMTSDDTFTGKFVQRALLEGRNPALADAVEKLLNSSAAGETVFVGIGMLHLTGASAVQKLLQERGYKVLRTY